MRVKEYRVLDMAVETGALVGVSRAFKHTDEPTNEQIAEQVRIAVMNEVCEWFEFEDEIDSGGS